MSAEQAEEFALLGGQLLLRFAIVHFCLELFFDALCIGFVRARVAEDLLLRVESIVLTDVVEGAFAVLLALNATKDRLDAEGEFFHRERLREVVVGADFESLEDIFFECFGREEDDRHFGIRETDLLCQGETILLGHHNVENTEVIFAAEKFTVSLFAVVAKHGVIAFCQEIFAEEHAEILVVLAEEDSYFSVKSHSDRYL